MDHVLRTPFLVNHLRLGVGGACLLVAVLASAKASACSTPVYRYALLNWASAPFYVFYFHQGAEPAEDRQVNQTLRDWEESQPGINFKLIEVDTTQRETIDRLDALVDQAWRRHGASAPLHLVMSSWGADLFAGRLTSQTLEAMSGSPLRKRFAELLDEGNAAVLLFVEGSDAKENRRVEKLLREVIDHVNRGDVTPSTARGSGGLESNAEAPAGLAAMPPTSSVTPKLASLTLSRNNEAETWLLRQLMAVEPDLADYATEPMVFAIYGRGRAMPPWIGAGIHRENLEDGVSFLLGACSCLVKEQNPGMDLLVRWDWEATADKLAAEEAGLLEGQLVYEELTPAALTSNSPAVEEPEESIAENNPQTPSRPEPEATDAKLTFEEEVPTYGIRQAWIFGIGLGALALVVLAAGFAWMTMRRG